MNDNPYFHKSERFIVLLDFSNFDNLFNNEKFETLLTQIKIYLIILRMLNKKTNFFVLVA